MCAMFEEKLPEMLKKPEKIGKKSVVDVHAFIDPLVVCCEQECQRFNKLMEAI